MLQALPGLFPACADWTVALEYNLVRPGARPDAILLSDRAIFVLEFKVGAQAHLAADLRQAEDYALDLLDFHQASRAHPILPLLIATGAPDREPAIPLIMAPGASPPLGCNGAGLAGLLMRLHAACPAGSTRLDPGAWLAAPYQPVPGIIDAACMVYARHNVPEIRNSRADRRNLAVTASAIRDSLQAAQRDRRKLAIFVTGIPGAGKTLCGLDICLTEGAYRATFLTGNPSLVHVLREALIISGQESGGERRHLAQAMPSVILALPRFRDDNIGKPAAPAERVIVIDEAQRCWSADYAVRKSRDRAVALTQSEPAHILDIMARHDGFCAVICLIGSGQEIHDGEGGLAEWGHALRTRPAFHVIAPPDLADGADPRRRLGGELNITAVPDLHLDVATRHIMSANAAAWVDALLRGDDAAAAQLARHEPLPFQLTRDAGAMRRHLRDLARGLRRAGLVASAGGKRLRAEGLGLEVPHMDAKAIANWFLRRYPQDVRASDALELIATEFAVQGLELDYVWLAWDLDLCRGPAGGCWRVQQFAGTNWQVVSNQERIANQMNTYRVLLTRARYATVIFVPPGDAADPTRPPAMYDAIADHLTRCGVAPLVAEAGPDRAQPGRSRAALGARRRLPQKPRHGVRLHS